MAVGPEAPGSLLLGSAIRLSSVHHGSDESGVASAHLASVITTTTGLIALIAGIVRLGFLDSVLSRPLLRGFISAVGFVIFVDQLILEMGLENLAKQEDVMHASSLTKFIWILTSIGSTHRLTFLVASVAFWTIMIGKYVQ